MRMLFSVLAIASTLAISSAASAQQIIVTAPAVMPIVPVMINVPGTPRGLSAPGYYRFEDTRYMVLRQGGRLLTTVERGYVDQIFSTCEDQVESRIPMPNPGHDKPIDMSGLPASFNSCVHAKLEAATAQNILPGDYIVMQSQIDNSNVRLASSEPDTDLVPLPR